MDSLSDPSSLRGRTAIEFREEQSVDEQGEFEYFASVDGMVAVGITNGAGAVLLMNGPHGWRLPYGPVDTDEDWTAAGRSVGEELAGVSLTITCAERVARITHREAGNEERKTTSYDVVLRTIPVTGEPIDDDPRFGPWDELEVRWFDSVPEDAYWNHGDAVDDIRLFVG
ncbi:hypothetical protein A4G99_12735 [Haladaptatus sp. R4]|uniref:NUDIX domain-containing protein n=1 Tax=Haladaptatus sp. R4 TaxID=1679489 RepID=UPI0007B4E573|nr:NUDIX domain-containing protein [Haladaptatus sp. R4]KZN23726.1 hypothetical protein A4G99_12735 [Haladaptatus sp. R4]